VGTRVFVSPRSARREDEWDPDRKQTVIATLLAIRIPLVLARPAGSRPATRTRVETGAQRFDAGALCVFSVSFAAPCERDPQLSFV